MPKFSKRSFFASLIIIISGVFIIVLNYYATEIFSYFPALPTWSSEAFSGIIILLLGRYFWRREHDFETMEYEFVNIVTHKFRTPLTYVSWSVENLKKDQTPEERQESVRQIETAVMRLTEMTGILIDVAKIEEGYSYVFKAESLREITEKVMQEYNDQIREKEIKFNIDMPYTLPLISIDVKRMEFVVRTLLENAITYTPRAGLIEIKVYQRGNESIVFAIKDSGIGMKRDDLRHIFDKFYRSHEATGADTEGMGLGLFIAKNIVERHGGRIKAESQGQNKGSIFTFELPLHHGL